MVTINAVTPDRQPYIVTCQVTEVAKQIKIMQNKKFLHIRVTNK